MTKKEKKEMVQKLNRNFMTEPELLGAFSPDSDEEVYNEHEYDPYDVTNLFSGTWNVSIYGRAAKAKNMVKLAGPKIRKGYILAPLVYEQTECFRYALPQ